MKYLKRFNQLNESHQSIDEICREYGIRNYSINPDGSVDVEGNVDLYNQNLTQLPLTFGRVSSNFDCSYNQLTSLNGAPKEVGGYFYCHHNQLTTLEGGPKEVGSFNCSHNQLTSLEGAPKEVDGNFYCHHNQLTTLEGAPKSVGGDFSCHHNQLTTLEGVPQSVGGDFSCGNNELRSFVGIPEYIGGDYLLGNNPANAIWNFFRDEDFFYKINNMYPDLWMGEDNSIIQGDILEQIAEELDIKLPSNWINILEKLGYRVINIEYNEKKSQTYKGRKIPGKYLTKNPTKMKKEIDTFRGKKVYKKDWDADYESGQGGVGKRVKTKKSKATQAYQKMFGNK